MRCVCDRRKPEPTANARKSPSRRVTTPKARRPGIGRAIPPFADAA
jgi:hypothetical protein